MTESDLERARELIATRDAITELLSARERESEFVQSYLNSKWDHEKKEGEQLPTARIASIQIRGGDAIDEDAAPTLAHWDILREVLEAGLHAMLPRITDELTALGIESQ